MPTLNNKLIVELETSFLDTDTAAVFGNAADGDLCGWNSIYDDMHILCYTKGAIPVMLFGDVRMGQIQFDRVLCEEPDEIMKLVGNSAVKCAAPFSAGNSNGLGASNASQMHYFVVSYENGMVLVFSFSRSGDKETYILQLVSHCQSNQDIDAIYPQPNVWNYDTILDITQQVWLYSEATNEISLLTFKHDTINAKITVQFNTSQGNQTDGDFGECISVESIHTTLGYNALTAFHFSKSGNKKGAKGGATITSFVVDARLVLHFAEKAWKGPTTIRLPGLPECVQLHDIQQLVSLQIDPASIADLTVATYSVSKEQCFTDLVYSYRVLITVSDSSGNSAILDVPNEQTTINTAPHTVLEHVVRMGSEVFAHPMMPLDMNFSNAMDTNVLMQFYNMNILNLMPLFEDKNKVDHNDFSAAREVLFDTALNAGLGSVIANYIMSQEGEEGMMSGSGDNYLLQDVKRVSHWAINNVKTRLEGTFLDLLQKRIIPYLINKTPTALLYADMMNGNQAQKVGDSNTNKSQYASMNDIQNNPEETAISLVETLNYLLVIADSLSLVIQALHERKSAQSHINDNDQDAKQEHIAVLDNLFLENMELKYLSQSLKVLMELVCCPGFSFACLVDGTLQQMYTIRAVQFKAVEKILPSLLMTSEGNTGPIPLTLFNELVIRLNPDAQPSAYLTDDGTSRRTTPSSRNEIIDKLTAFFLLPKENLSYQVKAKVEREAWVDMLDVGLSVMLHSIMDVFHMCYTNMSIPENNEMDQEDVDEICSKRVVIEGYTHRLQSFFHKLSIASDLVPSLRDALLNLWSVDASFIMGRTIPTLARSEIVLNDPSMIQAVIRRLLFTNKVEACRDLLFNTSNTNAIRTVFGCCAMAAAIPNIASWKAIWSTAKRHTRNLSREAAKEAKVGIIYIMIRWCKSNQQLSSFLESNFDNDEETEVERFLHNYVSNALAMKDHIQYVDGIHLYISWLLHRQKYSKAKEVHQKALNDVRKEGMSLGDDVSSKLLQEFTSMAM